MIGQPTEEEMQACLSLYEQLQTYLDETKAYDQIATVECINEDVFDQSEEEDEVIPPATLDDTPPKVKNPIEKVKLGIDKGSLIYC